MRCTHTNMLSLVGLTSFKRRPQGNLVQQGTSLKAIVKYIRRRHKYSLAKGQIYIPQLYTYKHNHIIQPFTCYTHT